MDQIYLEVVGPKGGPLSRAYGRAVLAAQPQPEAERERLRDLQADAVMPLIGPLLDAWECCSQSVREEHPGLDKHLRRINRAMEDAGDALPSELDDLKAQPQPEAQDEYPSVKQKRLLGEARAVLAAKGKP